MRRATWCLLAALLALPAWAYTPVQRAVLFGGPQQVTIPLTSAVPAGWAYSRGGAYAGTYQAGPLVANQVRNSAMVGAVAADGVERVTNGNFAADPFGTGGGWTKTLGGTGTITWNGSNTVTLTPDGTNWLILNASVSTVVGLTYTLTADVVGDYNIVFNVGTTVGGNQLGTTPKIGVRQAMQFTATTTTTYLAFSRNAIGAANVSNVSVQSAGRPPNNWYIAPQYGLIATILAVGSGDGLPSIDVSLAGTPSGTGNGLPMGFESGNAIAATNGQKWTYSIYWKQLAGSAANTAPLITAVENTSGGSYVTSGTTPVTVTTSDQRAVYTRTLSGGGTVGAVQPTAGVNVTSGQPVSVTYRIAAPQLEQSSTAGSFVPTSGAAASSGGFLAAASASSPRFETSMAGVPAGYLTEPAATGYLWPSNDLSSARWSKTDVTLTTPAMTAPDGAATARLVTEGSAGTAIITAGSTAATTDAATLAGQLFVKQGTIGTWLALIFGDGSLLNGVNCYVNLSTGAVGTVAARNTATAPSCTTEAIGSDWWRVKLLTTMPAGATNMSMAIRSASADNSGTRVSGANYYVWHMGGEINGMVTSPIVTVSGSVTRAADNLSVPLSRYPWLMSSGAGALAMKFTFVGSPAAAYPRMIGLVGANANTDELSLYTTVADSTFASNVLANNVSSGGAGPGAGRLLTKGVPHVAAMAWSARLVKNVLDGTISSGALSAGLPKAVTLLVGGAERFQPQPVERISSITLRAGPVSAVQLQAMH